MTEIYSAQPQLAEKPDTEQSRKMIRETIKELRRGDFNSDYSNLPDTVRQSPEVQEAVKEEIVFGLKNRHINHVLKLQETFSLAEATTQSPEVQQSARDALVLILKHGNIDHVLKIKEVAFLSDQDFQQAVKKGIITAINNTNINLAIKIMEVCSLPRAIIQSPEVQQAVKEELVTNLKNGNINYVLKIKESTLLSDEDFQQAVKDRIIFVLKDGNTNETLKIKEAFPFSDGFFKEVALSDTVLFLKNLDFFTPYVTPEDIAVAYTKNKEGIQNFSDAEVARNLIVLEEVLGAERTKRLLLGTPTFWGDHHDHLLFMGSFRSHGAQGREDIARIVLRPLLVPGVDLSSFGRSLNSFDIQGYIQERGEVPFRTVREFEREVQMQVLDIRIPESASDEFKEAIETLILAPGVDVPFIKAMTEEYELQKGGTAETVETEAHPFLDIENGEHGGDDNDDGESYEYDETPDGDFVQKLIDIIEGRDAIDGRQHIRPWEKEVPFDPLHKVILSSIGIRGLNEQSPKLFDRIRNTTGLREIIEALRRKDTARVEELKLRRDALKEKYPEKAGRYDAELKTSVKKETMLKFSSGDELVGVSIANRDAYALHILPEEWDALFAQLAETIRNDIETRGSVSRVFQALVDDDRRGMVDSFIDIEAGFFTESVGHIRELYREVVQEREGDLMGITDPKERGNILGECVAETVRRFLADEKVSKMAFVEFFLYLALNNRVRLEKSKKITNAVASLFGSRQGKEKYAEQLQRAKETNATQAYLKGSLILDEVDERTLRESYQSITKSGGVRTLGIEIAKKSDPRGWVCGDYTDCCMPFTSSKNKEYLMREDMSYFLVSKNGEGDNTDIIAQSVLIYGEDEGTITLVIDNIEIANRAVSKGERAVVAKAYEELREHIIDTYGNKGKRLKIVIGTSYNDDGGLVTGECEIMPVDAKPLGGNVGYSDWYHHSSNYVFYDSEAKEAVQKYYGLSIDAWESSRTHGYIAQQFADPAVRREHEQRIEDLLRKVGRGEDDGEGGLNFADNYSVALVRGGRQVGYIIAADYIKEDDADDLIHLEEMRLNTSLSEDEKRKVFEQYLKDKRFDTNDDLDGIMITQSVLSENPFVRDVVRQVLGGVESTSESGVLIRFE